MWHWGYGTWWGFAAMVVFWVLVVGLVVWGIRSAGRPGPGPDAGRRRALDVLEERYARGEIDDEEFRRRRDMLERS